MNKYTELKDKHSKMVNAFPMGFAFSDKQFEEAKEKLGIESNDELLSIAGGGLIRKTDSKEYSIMMTMLCMDEEVAMEDDEYLYQGFLYELANHEYGITYDPESTLDCFSLTIDEVNKDPRLHKIFTMARIKYLDGFEY